MRLWGTTAGGAHTERTANLRVCRDTFAVVPVVLGPDVDATWVEGDACLAVESNTL